MLRAGVLGLAIVVGMTLPSQGQERWAGAYGGLSLDMTESEGDVRGRDLDVSSDEVGLGVYAGWNFTRPGSGFVWGPELSLAQLKGDGRTSDGEDRAEFDGSYLLSGRVRAGYATEQLFFYGMVGLGMTGGGIRPVGNDDTDLLVSGVTGLGAEWATSPDWSVRVDVTEQNFDGAKFDFGSGKRKTNFSTRRLSLGLSRKF